MGQNPIGDHSGAFERQNPHTLLQVVSRASFQRKFAEAFATVKNAIDQRFGYLRVAGFGNNPVVYVLEVLVRIGAEKDCQPFYE